MIEDGGEGISSPRVRRSPSGWRLSRYRLPAPVGSGAVLLRRRSTCFSESNAILTRTHTYAAAAAARRPQRSTGGAE